MDPLHLYVVSIVCGGRESHRGVFLKRALRASDFAKIRVTGAAFASGNVRQARRGGVEGCPSLPKLCVATCIVAPKSGRSFQPWLTMRGESFRKCASFLFVPAPTARFCANRGRSPEVATRIFGNADTVGARWRGASDRQFSEMRTPSALGGAELRIANSISREWEGHRGSSITRIFGRTATRIFGSGSCRRGAQLVWAGSWRLPDDFCAPTTSGSSRSRRRRASKRRLNCRWSLRAASAACSRRTPALPSFGGGPPDRTLLAASMISIWSEAT